MRVTSYRFGTATEMMEFLVLGGHEHEKLSARRVGTHLAAENIVYVIRHVIFVYTCDGGRC